MIHLSCRQERTLTEKEKKVFSEHLRQEALSENIWDLFGEWVARSTPEVHFFYLKVYSGEDLEGLALFLRIKPVDLRSSYAGLRQNPHLNKIAGGLSALMRNCVYVSFRNLVTSNLTRPFFYRDPGMADEIMTAVLAHLKNEKEADMVTIIDTLIHDDLYQAEGFTKYPSSSEAWLDVSRYRDVSEYLAEHRNLRKNLRRRKNRIRTEVQQGPLSDIDKSEMKACVECSVETTRVNNPCQKFFEDAVFETEVFNSDKYVHVVVRNGHTIAGFHTFQVSGSNMGGVLGGFNREYCRNNFVYERVIVASLEYAIHNNLKRVHYSLIDNYTKLRLVDSLEPCALYFYSGSPLNRNVFRHTYRFNDIHALHLLENQGRKEG